MRLVQSMESIAEHAAAVVAQHTTAMPNTIASFKVSVLKTTLQKCGNSLEVREALDATNIYFEERPRVIECMRSLESYGEDLLILAAIGEQFEGHGGVHAFEQILLVYADRFSGCLSPAVYLVYLRRLVNEVLEDGAGCARITAALQCEGVVPGVLNYAKIMASKEEAMGSASCWKDSTSLHMKC